MESIYKEKISKLMELASDHFIKVAESGDVSAQYTLAICYLEGLGLKQDTEEGIKWLTKAADSGHTEAQNILAYRFMHGEGIEKDAEKAIKYLKMAVEHGDDNAQLNLGICYANGEGVEQNYSEALRLLKLSADQGNPEAWDNLRRLYADGKGVEKNERESLIATYISDLLEKKIAEQKATDEFNTACSMVNKEIAQEVKQRFEEVWKRRCSNH